ncbi:MAG: hypothetical protein E7497_03740 [Ruminococcus sp.]|nr:hypothetical protein [Ruminococcus sp.]
MKEQDSVSAENREEARVKRLKRTLFAVVILNMPVYISCLLNDKIGYQYELSGRYADNPVLRIIGMWLGAWFVYVFFVPPVLTAVFLVRDILKRLRAGEKPVMRIIAYILLAFAVLAVFFAIYRFMYSEVEMSYCI